MGLPENRMARLRAWINDQFDGNVASFCRYYQMKRSMASFIYQLEAGSRVFGERAARRLESECGRPSGWLDLPLEQDTSDPIQYDRALCRMLPVRDRRLIEDFIKLILERSDLKDRGGAGPSVFLRPEDERTIKPVIAPSVGKNRKRSLNINEPETRPPTTTKRRSTR